ncbi:conserved hypothetical protein [Burkholderia mallei PRL-20]|nr:hypothetical protein BMAJHU_C0409 [Burkholderia mallei JHU]EDK85883.1 hypothetical protein BMA721280_A0231 [Burkholderia mallei 2002721280]EDP88581.1 hypothetical protein BMA10399_E0474 [Burkholderia mallei ATCC 10399]EEP86456.1 conserved hypothetical protein [Burkholderia mallei GB8 horse 4]EES44560.1 conserved hypothetical protein [Burkholderia mallei PRL-20]
MAAPQHRVHMRPLAGLSRDQHALLHPVGQLRQRQERERRCAETYEYASTEFASAKAVAFHTFIPYGTSPEYASLPFPEKTRTSFFCGVPLMGTVVYPIVRALSPIPRFDGAQSRAAASALEPPRVRAGRPASESRRSTHAHRDILAPDLAISGFAPRQIYASSENEKTDSAFPFTSVSPVRFGSHARNDCRIAPIFG